MTEVGCGTGRCKTENKGDVSEKSMPLRRVLVRQ